MDDMISRSALLKHVRICKEAVSACANHDYMVGYASALSGMEGQICAAPAVDVEPVRYGRCALCRIKETGHGIIAFYKAGWQACITKRDGGYFMVIGHEGDQVHIPVDFCYNCGAKLDGDDDAAD